VFFLFSCVSLFFPCSLFDRPITNVNDEWKVNYIPGLRTDNQYRSRSAPPRRMLGHDSDRNIRVSHFRFFSFAFFLFVLAYQAKMYVDESNSNPVLVNRRYPEMSDRQATRWSTETKDSFRWKNKR
jgi:hypothetical protein